MKITDLTKNTDLEKQVEPTNDLKEMLVNHVGQTLKPETKEFTLEMVITVVAAQFPEFMLAVAEENYIRGYDQAFVDMEEMKKLYKTDYEQ